MQFFLVAFCLVARSSSFSFHITEPAVGLQILTGSQLIIRWILNNVTLPIPNVSVNIDAYRVGYPDEFYSTIVEHAENTGEYMWNIPIDWPANSDGFKLLISAPGHASIIPCLSQTFQIAEENTQRLGSITVAEPLPLQTYYPSQQLNIKWIAGPSASSFPWGVHIEFRKPVGGAILTIDRNVSFDATKEGLFKWTVPTEKLYLNEPLVSGRIFIWGYDSNTGANTQR